MVWHGGARLLQDGAGAGQNPAGVSDSPSFCLIPWLHRFTDEQGFHQLCCSGEGAENFLQDSAGQPLHISQLLTDAEVLNSPRMKATRLAMLKGEWPAACERCRRTEASGSVSMRMHMSKRFGRWSEEKLALTQADGSLESPRVHYADIRLGNTCNLTCRMCGPGASRLWVEHVNKVMPGTHQLSAELLASYRDNNWVKRQSVEWLLSQSLDSIESLHFAGGEPLIIPEMVELLELCVESGRASEIELSYNTNLTVLPEKVTRYWPHFRSVAVLCSIDGYAAVNDYIRRPSKWKDIDRNLHLLDENFERWRLRRVIPSATVQIYNVLQLDELYDYFGSQFQNVSPVPLLTALYGPLHLSIQQLPDGPKRVARERLLALRERIAPFAERKLKGEVASLDSILTHLELPSSRIEFAHFLYFSEQTDRLFGQSWRESCPELARQLKSSR